MANYKQLFMNYMDAKGVKYTNSNDHVVKVVYSGDNLKSIPVYVSFDEDGDSMIQVYCFEIANFNNNAAAGLFACNELNKKYRWVKFYLDKDNDIICSLDAYIDDVTCGEECLKLVRRVVNITDEAYPTFMKALWS